MTEQQFNQVQPISDIAGTEESNASKILLEAIPQGMGEYLDEEGQMTYVGEEMAKNLDKLVDPSSPIQDDKLIGLDDENIKNQLKQPIITSTQEPASIMYRDMDGNLYETGNSYDVVNERLNMTFPDPPIEEKKKQALEDIRVRKEQDLSKIQTEADDLISQGKLSQKRRDKYVAKRTDEITKQYQQEEINLESSLTKEYKSQNNLSKDLKIYLGQTDKSINKLNRRIERLTKGQISQDDYILATVDKTYLDKDKITREKGITTVTEFIGAYERGEVKPGDIIFGYKLKGHISDVPFEDKERPVFYMAFENPETGERRVGEVTQAVVDKKTGTVLGGIPLERNIYLEEVLINPKYTYATAFNQYKTNIEDRVKAGELTREEADLRIKKHQTEATETLKQNVSVYNQLINDPKTPKELKYMLIASVYPNQFEDKLTEVLSQGKSKGAIDYIVKGWGMFATALPKLLQTQMELGSEALLTTSQAAQSREDVEFQMGLLPLELKKNPKLGEAIMNILEKAGDRKNKYLTSISGLNELIKLAYTQIKVNISESDIKLAKNIVPEMSQLLTEFTGETENVKNMMVNHQNGLLEINNKSGYLDALKEAQTSFNNLTLNKDEKFNEAYKFLFLRNKIEKQGISSLSEEEKSFMMDKMKADEKGRVIYISNNKGLLEQVFNESKAVAEKFQKAQSLFPAQAIKDYQQKNGGRVQEVLNRYNKLRESFMNSKIFDKNVMFMLNKFQDTERMFGNISDVSSSYIFPMLREELTHKPAFYDFIPDGGGIKFGIGLMTNLGYILRSGAKTIDHATRPFWKEIDLTGKYLSADIQEFRQHLESGTAKTGDFLYDLPGNIAGALPHMVGFSAATIAGGPAGGIGYLTLTGAGNYMQEAANAGLGVEGQIAYTVIATGIEFLSEQLTRETAFLRGNKSKSIIGKELIERFLVAKTRREAAVQIARNFINYAKQTGKSGILESAEEHVADKLMYMFETYMDNVHNTTFNPSMMNVKESFENLVVMTATGAIFKGGMNRFGFKRDPANMMRKEAQETMGQSGMSTTESNALVAVSTPQGLSQGLQMINDIESGVIPMSKVNQQEYEYFKNVAIPAGMNFNFKAYPNATIQGKVVAMLNSIKINEVEAQLENGQISPDNAATAIQQFSQNAEQALTDNVYAEQQFGMTNSEMSTMITEYFGMSDMMLNDRTGIGIDIQQEQAPAIQQQEVIDKAGLSERLSQIVLPSITKKSKQSLYQKRINQNPEKALAYEIENTKSLIEIATDKYNSASEFGPAKMERMKVEELNERLQNLETLKQQYNNSQLYAINTSEREGQEINQQGGLVQYPGAQEGQPQIGQGEGTRREETQRSADYRNRNFGGQAQTAFQEITALPDQPPILQTYAGSVQPGQEVALMDEIASQVAIDEPAAIRQFGQPIVDRVKQYMGETAFTTNLPVVSRVRENIAEANVSDSKQRVLEAVNALANTENKANKSAVNTLVKQLQKAFPNIGVVMDKKGFNEAMQDETAKDLATKGGVVYGRMKDGTVYLNPDFANYNTPIHEFGHVWLNTASVLFPNVYNRGLELIRESDYMKKLVEDPLYAGLTGEALENEALATAIGDRGEQFVVEAQKQGFRNWVRRMVRKLTQFAGIFNMSDNQLDSLNLDTYLNMASASVLGGQQITEGIAGGEGMMAKPGTFVDEKQRIINDMLSRMTLPATKIDYMLTIASGMFEHLNLANRQETIDNLKSFYPELDVQRLEELARKNHPFAFKAEGDFMAKKDPVGETLKALAENSVRRELAKGRTLEEARVRVKSDVSAYAIANVKNYERYISSEEGVNSFLDNAINAEISSQRSIINEQNRQRALGVSLGTQQGRDLVEKANIEAQRLKDLKVKAKDAYNQLLEKVKADIVGIYERSDYPKNISELEMTSLAPAIASDAMMAAYPAQNRYDDETVTMNTAEWIRSAVANQIRGIDVAKKVDSMEQALTNIFKSMSQKFGRGIEFSPSKVKKIASAINENLFSRFDIASSVDLAANEITKIVEQEYRDLLTNKTKALLEKLNSRAGKADYGSAFIRSKVSNQLTNINPKDWVYSTATLEDISLFNQHIRTILAGDLSFIDRAIDITSNIQIDNRTRVENEFKSLSNKMNNLTKKLLDGTIDFSDYGDLLSLQKSMEDIKERKGETSALSPEQQKKLNDKFQSLEAALPSGMTIDRMIAEKEAEIEDTLFTKVSEARQDFKGETSRIRSGIKNSLSYYQFVRLMDTINFKYIVSLSPKEKLSLINAIDGVMVFGNYNHRTYQEYVKAMTFKVRTGVKELSKNFSSKRASLSQNGIVNAFQQFVRTFTNVEGGIPTPENIKNNLLPLRIHLMDVELNTGRDDFEMGFIEREILGPMAMAIDAAANKAQAQLEDLQAAMIAFSDKENYSVVKRAIANLDSEYNLSTLSSDYKMIKGMIRRGYGNQFLSDVSVRMASIVAHQIDHISNLEEGQIPSDIVLKRNIFEDWEKYDGVTTMYNYYVTQGMKGALNSATSTYEKKLDAIAYAALTNNGRETLADFTQAELESKLTEKQREGLNMWRSHIAKTQELVESVMITKGDMKALIKNYFPRRVYGQNTISQIPNNDPYEYMNGQGENVGLRYGQIQERTGEKGRIDLNGNRVLYNNMKMLHMINEVKPYMDYIKGIGEASNELADELDEITGTRDEYARVFAKGLDLLAKERLNFSLLMNDKSINDNFSGVFRAVSALQAFSAKMWLISVTRQLFADYPANVAKLAFALAGANRKLNNQVLSIITKKNLRYKTDKGVFEWDDYMKIAEFTGSPIVRTMSIYADNFLYEYRKSPEQIQREQGVASWQDIRIKKFGWMSRFEEAFEKITGDSFDHEAFSDERGSYRATYLSAVDKASSVADSFIDRQFGLSSFTRQELRVNVLLPFVGRGLRNIWNRITGRDDKLLTMSKDNPASIFTGFLQGYPTTQHALYNSYMKQAMSFTSGLSFGKRVEYMSRAITESILPATMYVFSRTFASTLFATTSMAIWASEGSDEEKKKLFENAENMDFWQEQMLKLKLRMKSASDELLPNLLNPVLSTVIDPQAQFTLRIVLGYLTFHMWKEKATEELNRMDLTKEQRSEKKMAIRRLESQLFSMFNVKPIDMFSSRKYDEVIKFQYRAGEATQSWENLAMTITSSQALFDAVKNFKTSINLYRESKDNPNLNKTELTISTIMQAYGLIFANYIIGGKFGPFLSMISGDATKFSKMMLTNIESEHINYMREIGKEQGPFMIIPRRQKKAKQSGGPSRGVSGRGASGVRGRGR